MRKAWRTDFQAVRLVGAIADDVNAEFTLGMLDGGIGFAFGNVKAFGKQLEMMNQLLHIGLH